MQQDASTQELLPCPFDGRADYLNIGSDHIDGDTRFQAWCNYCGMTGPHEATEAEAITAWNTRIEHTPSDRNAVLEEAAKVAEAVGTSFDTADNEALGIGELIRDVGSEIATAIRALTTTPEPTEPAGVAGLADELSKFIWRWEARRESLNVRPDGRLAFVKREAERIVATLQAIKGAEQ